MTECITTEELALEMANLQQELKGLIHENGQDDPEKAVWLFRLFQGVESESLNEIITRPDFSQWLALPIDGDIYPLLKKLQSTLECLAYQTEHDPLTGLANRRAFDRFLDMEF